jgi:uncharacterized protein (TIGR02217 family)
LGPWDSFLFWDPSDNTAGVYVDGVDKSKYQKVATGDGNTKSFQLVRTYGSETRPVYDINGVTASGTGIAAPPPMDTSPSSGSISSTGVLSYSVAPGSVDVTATFGFFWRVHFAEDSMDFSNFAKSFWETKKVVLEQVRT